MTKDSCGCLWEWQGDLLDIIPCSKDSDSVERAQALAWRMVAKKGLSFREAWERIMRIVFACFFSRLGSALCEVKKEGAYGG